VNIGNRTSVKSGDIRHIEHRIAIWHRYRFGSWSHSAAGRDTAACLPMLGSADNNYCSTVGRVHARRAFDLRARYPISCQTPGCIRRRRERGGVDKGQAIEWCSRAIDS